MTIPLPSRFRGILIKLSIYPKSGKVFFDGSVGVAPLESQVPEISATTTGQPGINVGQM